MSYNKYKDDKNVPILNYFGLLRTPKKIICTLSLRGRTQSLYSLLNTVTCPFRCPLTCLILTSRLSASGWDFWLPMIYFLPMIWIVASNDLIIATNELGIIDTNTHKSLIQKNQKSLYKLI